MGVVRQDVVQIGFDIEMSELKKLSSELDDVKKTLTDGMGDDAFDEMIKDGKKASESVEDIKDSLKGIKPDGVDKTVKGLKDTEQKSKDAHTQLKKIANTGFEKTISGLKKIGSALGTVAIKAGKVLAKGLAAGAAGVAAIVGKSVTNFADYEQLVGGVDTLFKDSSSIVQKNAQNAFNTAGLSANDYMETVTSFSASLINSLGKDTVKAADYAHMAIVDMSDNANKMGTDMSSIQDAYQGFAKQNYTMLDNLKLGYGGTQSEMKRLLKDAQKIQKANGKNVKYSIKSFSDIVEAIHVIQEEMGITGTTSKEASETISGSFASMKAAWSNTLTSLILGGDDFDRCVDNLVESAKTFAKNVMPAIQKALSGVGSLIEELSPIIEKELPVMIDTLLPPLIKAATALIKGLIIALPDIIGVLVDELPGVLEQVWEGISEAFGDIPGMTKVEEFFGKLKTVFVNNAGTIKKVIGVLLGLVAAFKVLSKLKVVAGLFGGKSAGGGGIFSIFNNLAELKPGIVMRGMFNLGIILGGLGILAAALMAVSPYLAQLSDLKSIGEVLTVIATVGLIGTAMSKLAGMVGNIPVAVVTKGLANIAIVMVGFGALAAALMWLAPYMAQLSDIKTTFTLLGVIGAVGLVGAGLTGLAGLIGAIPVGVVLSGLLNIALALGGITAIITAFGALSKIDGFNDFITSGGETLSKIFNVIGQCAGSLIGGLGEGVSNSLPVIAQNISTFASTIGPAMTSFASMNSEGLSSFSSAFSSFIGVMAGEKILSVITGGTNYAELGTNLSTFATNVSGFFSTIAVFDEGSFAKATALFNCLANISSLPKEGGVVGWFQGEVNYTNMATGLNQLASASGFFTTVATIPEAAFTAATNLFNCLAGVKSLPKDGGIAQWFTGTIAFDSIATGLQTLTSESMVAALTTIAGIPATAYTGLTSMFDALAGIKAMPSEGGIAQWFTGDKSTGLGNITSQLPQVATDIATFFTNLGGRTDFSPIKSLFDTLGSISIDSEVAEGTGIFGLGASQLETMGTGLANFATNASLFFEKINGLNLGNLTGFFNFLSTAGNLPTNLLFVNAQLGTVLTTMSTMIETSMATMKTNVSTSLNEIVGAINAMRSSFYNAGVNIMRGLNSGMKSMEDTLVETAQQIAESIENALNVRMDINSPSKVMFDSGVFIGQGLVKGMRSYIPNVQTAASEIGAASDPYYRNSYSPESANTVYNNGGNSEYTTISPVFNLTISGSQDDRALAKKVKRFVSEAIQETFESLERKTYTAVEV